MCCRCANAIAFDSLPSMSLSSQVVCDVLVAGSVVLEPPGGAASLPTCDCCHCYIHPPPYICPLANLSFPLPQSSQLFDGARQRFLDALLAAARVEVYLPNVRRLDVACCCPWLHACPLACKPLHLAAGRPPVSAASQPCRRRPCCRLPCLTACHTYPHHMHRGGAGERGPQILHIDVLLVIHAHINIP